MVASLVAKGFFISNVIMLKQLFQKYSAVDNHEGTDKGTTHSYDDLYEKLLIDYRATANEVLEIGVFSGAGCLVFSEYFTNANITGIDISLKHVKFGINHPRIHYHELDATDEAACMKFTGPYDVIIEDASHLPEHQVRHLDIFAGRLRPNGIYIIEDIVKTNVPHLRPLFQSIADKHNMKMQIHDLTMMKNRYDDVLAVFTKVPSKKTLL